uniref:Uncharacterized protein n=1 Tax=uncultured Nocardioidaceae bacterium TaxID=253824 RepID=A0A6J4LX29_9ACTN|nr:MAG: hypothetical protein AVDCRST_MAG46-2127 [uncultured Nocardioidaceae bacterium]
MVRSTTLTHDGAAFDDSADHGPFRGHFRAVHRVGVIKAQGISPMSPAALAVAPPLAPARPSRDAERPAALK